MTAERFDVLAVLEADATDAACERQWYEDAEELANRSQQARAAVAELIAADKEYDEAQHHWEYVAFHSKDDTTEAEWKIVAGRYEAASVRRIAALARMEPKP